MCGIAGIANADGLGPLDARRLDWISAGLIHRGPDGAGEYQEAKIALAMRRLAVIDPQGGAQPLFNEDRSLVLIANAEIYNHVELRRELQARGHVFSTGSDCETIVHLFEESGWECVHRLRGMFAFALWDSRSRRLLLARDRMGEKPLYLYETPGRLVFASELGALLRSGLVPFELDPAAIHQFFHFNYVPEPATPILGVRKLDAAHVYIFDVDTGSSEETCYWRIEDAPPLDDDPVERIRGELEDICALTLRSDVPVGLALSGGLDSGALAALCAPRYPGSLHCFTVGYTDRPGMDEREGARRLATRLGLPFHEVEISPAEVAADFTNLVACTDDPVADISGSSYFRLHRLAADSGVKVLLSGQGGDELFWGYPWVKEGARQSAEKAALLGGGDGMHSRAWWNTVRDQRPARGEQRSAGDRSWWRRPIDWRRSPWLRGAAFLSSAPDRFVFSDLVPEFRDAAVEAHRLFTERLLAAVPTGNSSLPFTRPIGDWGNVPVSISALVARTYLRANGVVQGDRLSMANSVEQRSPFLDHQLWDVVQGLRKSSSDHRLPPKSWLKRAVADIVPPELLDVAKRGFTPPGKEWAMAIIGVHGEALRDGSLVREGICRPERIDQILRHPDEMYELLFKCIVLDQWILAARSAAHSHDVVGQADAAALTG